MLSSGIMGLWAQDQVEAHLGADIVSDYIWRGQDFGNVSLQPELSVAWKGLSLSAWGSVGLSDTSQSDRHGVTLPPAVLQRAAYCIRQVFLSHKNTKALHFSACASLTLNWQHLHVTDFLRVNSPIGGSLIPPTYRECHNCGSLIPPKLITGSGTVVQLVI